MIKTTNLLILVLAALISIAFFTLMERKLISYTQTRKGPNKATTMGIMQPMADAVKLMTKELNMNLKSNFSLYMMSPAMNMLCAMMMWITMPMMFNFTFMKMSMVFIMICTTMSTMTIMMMSWASNSNYAFIGMMRTISQMISYEINFMMIMITVINLSEQMNMSMMSQMQKNAPMMMIMPSLMIMWMISTLAETNRTPFDFSEGESELISGFNIEFSSKSFMLLFLAEYSSILLMSVLTSVMFTTTPENLMMFMMSYTSVATIFIWTRATLPRFRYDKLMKLNWTQILPATTFLLLVSFVLKMYYTMKIKKLEIK